jgi:hypothetical protein
MRSPLRARLRIERVIGFGAAEHFPATWAGTQIMTARQFIDAVM